MGLRADYVLGSWIMKKLLGIVVLGLLWCNTVSSHEGHTFEFKKSGFIYNDNRLNSK